MNASFWSLACAGVEKSFADWGIDPQCRRELFSLAPDRFTFRVANLQVDSLLPFGPGAICLIKRNGIGYFAGRVTRIRRSATPSSESIDYELSGPWRDLDVIPFQQSWNIASNPTSATSGLVASDRSRVIMYQDTAGGHISTASMIALAVGYAQGKGALLTYAGSSIAVLAPTCSEVQDQMCGEIIRSALKWNPDAVSWFDYTVYPPALHIASQSALSAKSVALADAPSGSVSITPRYDLQCSGVTIIYEAVNSINEVSWTTVTRDQVGGNGLQSVVMTVELGGSSLTTQIQKLSITSIDITSRAFWESLLPWLHQATNVTIENVRLNNVLVTGQSADPTDGASGYAALALKDFTGETLSVPLSTSNFVNVLTGGQVPHWLESQFSDAAVACKITYTLRNPESKAEETKEKVPFTAKFKMSALNASPFPQTFEQQSSCTPAEPIPSGIAAAYYAAASILHYEGSYDLLEDEVSAAIGVGHKLNITGGPAEWASMNAIIQSVSEDLATGRTQLRFGPPGHLSVSDFIELQRVQRGRSPSYRLQERVDGKYSGAGSQVAGAIQVVQGANAPAQQPGKALTLGTKDTTMIGQIQLNLDDLKTLLTALGLDMSSAADPHLKLRTVDVCMDDPANPGTQVAGKMVVLASAPVKNP